MRNICRIISKLCDQKTHGLGLLAIGRSCGAGGGCARLGHMAIFEDLDILLQKRDAVLAHALRVAQPENDRPKRLFYGEDKLMARISSIGLLGGMILLFGMLVSCQVIPPANLHDFESDDFYKTSAEQTSPGDTGLLISLDFEQELGGRLSTETDLETHVYPNFLPEVRRYGWYPYQPSDRLVVTPTWAADVTTVTVDGKPHSVTDPISLKAKKHGREVSITASTEDGARTANYVFLTLPHTFPPLKTKISSVEDVAPGIITGLQGAPNNPTFSVNRQARISLYNSGLRGTLAANRKRSMQPFDDFIAANLEESLDFEHRVYLPFTNFVLDQFGTPLKYNNAAPRSIFVPFETSKDEGLIPEHGFIYKEFVMDSDLNFAEAMSRSYIQPFGDEKRTEIPRHLDQFDDGHHIAMTPWDTIQNLFYRIHPAGTELNDGTKLDVNVTSTYIVELDREGNVIWEWDSIDHFKPDQSTTYLPKDRYSEWDYFHTNGIRFSPNNEYLIVSARHLRAVAGIDYPSGEVSWVLADPASPLNQFTYIGDPLGGLSTLHAAEMRGTDELLVFDNGHFDTPEYREGSIIYDGPIDTRHDYTRVVSYKLDFDAMTATYQREWTHSDRLTRTAGYLMFVPRTDGDQNMLVSWGSAGFFTEHSPENELIMETETGGMTYRFYKTNIDDWVQ